MTPILSVGATIRLRRARGVSLVEALIVVSLIALLAALSYAPVSAGLETLRLRAASDTVVKLLTTALDRAERHQSVVEVQILPVSNAILARTADLTFSRRLDLPQGTRIVGVAPAAPGVDPRAVRRFLLYPGGAVPRIAVELEAANGRRRVVSLDPLTGSAVAQEGAP
jgi:type II secretory pathway pseudopilin PulG